MLRFIRRIRPCCVSLGGGGLDGERMEVARFSENRLAQRQRRGRLVAGVVVSAPQWRGAIELLEHRDNYPCGVVHRRRVATTVVGHQQLIRFFSPGQEAPERAVDAVIQ